MPPINSFTNWLDFNNAVIEPTSNTLLNKEFESSLISAYGINKIMEIIIWRSKRDKMLLNQLLKKPSVNEVDRHNIAKGEISIKTFIRMYLNEKLMMSANAEIESIPR